MKEANRGGFKPQPVVRKSTSTGGSKKEATDDLFLAQRHHRRERRNRVHLDEKNNLRKQRSVSDLLTDLLLNDKENRSGSSSGSIISSDDFRSRPDLWMAAFDNPMEFIQYCRKRLDHQREVLEKSVQNENYISRTLTQILEKFEKQEKEVRDLFTVQNLNEKLHHVLLEERTHCQHLIGENDRLECQRRMMSRKYQAALLLGKVDEKAVHHLLEKNPKAVPLADKMAELGDELKKCESKSNTSLDSLGCMDPLVLSDRLVMAEEYIKALKRTHRDEVAGLTDTIDNFNSQFEGVHQSYEAIIQKQTDLLEGQKAMLESLTRENLDLRSELLKKEDKFLTIQMDELDKSHRKKPSRPSNSKQDIAQAFEQAEYVEKSLKARLAKAEIDLIEKSNILRDATSKMLVLERRCSHLQEEMDVMKKSHKTCITTLMNRNDMFERRCEKAEDRRKFDNEGYRAEIKELRSILKSLRCNVNLIIKKYGDVELEKKGFSKPDVKLLDEILKKGGGVSGRCSAGPVRLGPKVSSADPVTNQKALSIWSEYVGKRIDELEDDLDPKLQMLYKNKYLNLESSGDSLDGLDRDPRRSARRNSFYYRASSDENTSATKYYEPCAPRK
ncbi:Coiled-coil domain-containing protein 77 [Orchesella cincta]|uniref:Coiled-coil domain-containing protein 77 n=1 Tax=Orchesella cincta TaxID=48709 RepID=A0A1D2NFV8_ORCCI|nr:Coiled-coil domain-containing protein 77 [Orchesella cincta]